MVAAPAGFWRLAAKTRGDTLEVPTHRQDYFADFLEHSSQRVAKCLQGVG